jgi:hypothetical protein
VHPFLGLPGTAWDCLAGWSALPLEPGTVDAVACHQATRNKR